MTTIKTNAGILDLKGNKELCNECGNETLNCDGVCEDCLAELCLEEQEDPYWDKMSKYKPRDW